MALAERGVTTAAAGPLTGLAECEELATIRVQAGHQMGSEDTEEPGVILALGGPLMGLVGCAAPVKTPDPDGLQMGSEDTEVLAEIPDRRARQTDLAACAADEIKQPVLEEFDGAGDRTVVARCWQNFTNMRAKVVEI